MTVQLLGHTRGLPKRSRSAPQGPASGGSCGPRESLSPLAPHPPPLPVPPEAAELQGCPAPLLSGNFPFSGSLHPDSTSLSITPGADPPHSRTPPAGRRTYGEDKATATVSNSPFSPTPARDAVRRKRPPAQRLPCATAAASPWQPDAQAARGRAASGAGFPGARRRGSPRPGFSISVGHFWASP